VGLNKKQQKQIQYWKQT